MKFIKVKLDKTNIKYGHCLKVDNVNDLLNYHEKYYKAVISEAIDEMVKSREWQNIMKPKKERFADHCRSFIGSAIAQFILMGKSPYEVIDKFSGGVFKDQIYAIEKHGCIYIQDSSAYFSKNKYIVEYGEEIKSND